MGTLLTPSLESPARIFSSLTSSCPYSGGLPNKPTITRPGAQTDTLCPSSILQTARCGTYLRLPLPHASHGSDEGSSTRPASSVTEHSTYDTDSTLQCVTHSVFLRATKHSSHFPSIHEWSRRRMILLSWPPNLSQEEPFIQHSTRHSSYSSWPIAPSVNETPQEKAYLP